jgi:hypothetical protein
MYDGRVGRWMTTDPYSQYHSPYLAMGNNPVKMIDPDGGRAYGIGVNSSGREVYNDGIKDGKFYYLGDYNGDLITSETMLFDKMISGEVNNFSVWMLNYNWVGTDNDLRTLVSGQWNFGNLIDYTPLIGDISFNTNTGYKMQLEAFSMDINFDTGSATVTKRPNGQWIFRISDNKLMWDDISILRSSLTHENFHFKQTRNALPVRIFPTLLDYRIWGPTEELQAYIFQKANTPGGFGSLNRNYIRQVDGNIRMYEGRIFYYQAQKKKTGN